MREEADDTALVRAVAAGDARALESLYARYGTIVFGMVYRLLGDRQAAEECTQDVFVAVWRGAASYDEGRSRVTTWVLTIARNRAIDVARRRAARAPTARAAPPTRRWFTPTRMRPACRG